MDPIFIVQIQRLQSLICKIEDRVAGFVLVRDLAEIQTHIETVIAQSLLDLFVTWRELDRALLCRDAENGVTAAFEPELAQLRTVTLTGL